jgi:hypothetical protein
MNMAEKCKTEKPEPEIELPATDDALSTAGLDHFVSFEKGSRESRNAKKDAADAAKAAAAAAANSYADPEAFVSELHEEAPAISLSDPLNFISM